MGSAVFAKVKRDATTVPIVRADGLDDLLRALKTHDSYTAGHSRRVASYAALLAELIGLEKDHIELVHRAALAHDVGKLGVPHSLLAKNIGLTSEEFAHIRQHTEIGAELLTRTSSTRELVTIVEHHHEHWDGYGYPHGLSGSDIPLESRVILVADAFDAMTTARPYDPMISSGAALMEILHCSGQQFDPIVAAAIKTALDEGLLQRSDLAPALLL